MLNRCAKLSGYQMPIHWYPLLQWLLHYHYGMKWFLISDFWSRHISIHNAHWKWWLKFPIYPWIIGKRPCVRASVLLSVYPSPLSFLLSSTICLLGSAGLIHSSCPGAVMLFQKNYYLCNAHWCTWATKYETEIDVGFVGIIACLLACLLYIAVLPNNKINSKFIFDCT